MDIAGTGRWTEATSTSDFGIVNASAGHYRFTTNAGTNTETAGVSVSRVNATQSRIHFGRYYASFGTTPLYHGWGDLTVNSRWRVSKSRNPLSVGGLTTTKWQRKVLATTATTTTSVAGLQFNNLVVGKTYKMSSKLEVEGTASAPFSATMRWRSDTVGGGTIYAHAVTQIEATSVGRTVPTTINFTFTAVSSVLALDLNTSSCRLLGTASYQATWAELEELPLHSQTSEWT